MAQTFRDLINDAYRESGVVGIGMTVESDQLSEGLGAINLVLDGIYAKNQIVATIAVPTIFTGVQDYTIGPSPTNGDPDPDIVVPQLPVKIDRITVYLNGVRNQALPIDPATYFSRSLETIRNQLPVAFFFERTSPIGTIKFLDGTPGDKGEIIYKQAMINVTANTLFEGFPISIRPYLIFKTAERIASNNGFDATGLRADAKEAWKDYQASCYEGQSYMADGSAPGQEPGELKYNIFKGD